MKLNTLFFTINAALFSLTAHSAVAGSQESLMFKSLVDLNHTQVTLQAVTPQKGGKPDTKDPCNAYPYC